MGRRSARVRLTKKVIKHLELPTEGHKYAWDSEVPGLAAAATPTGCRTFYLDYTTATGRRRRPSIGRCDVLSVEEARAKARRMLAAVANGEDPSADKAALRRAPTVDQLASRYLREHALPHKKESSVRKDSANLKNHVLPALGRMKVIEVDYEHVAALHQKLGAEGKKGAANRVIALLSKMFNLAEKWKYRPQGTNPCRHVAKFPEKPSHRVLTPDELSRLGRVLSNCGEKPTALAAIRLLIFTGCRRNEVLKLRWSEVDFEGGLLRLTDSKTGAQVVPLSSAAKAVLKEQQERALLGNEYVFPSPRKPKQHLHDLNGPWYRMREEADLGDVRLHDLRHTVGAVGSAQGIPLQTVGAILGHRTAATTQRYAVPDTDPRKSAIEKIGTYLAEALGETARN